jgi:hypothetical protein
MKNDTCDHDWSFARQKIVHDVNVFGWHVMQVLPGRTHPGWSYSIGLHRNFHHPEVVIFGLGPDTMHGVINIVGRAAKSGRKFHDDDVSDELLVRYACTFRAVDSAWVQQLLGFATWFYDSATFPVLQVFWPDQEHRYPWQPGFDAGLRDQQPLLFNSDAVAARARGLVQAAAPTAAHQRVDS